MFNFILLLYIFIFIYYIVNIIMIKYSHCYPKYNNFPIFNFEDQSSFIE